MLQAVSTSSSSCPAWLLVSDIDDTLTGDDAALERLLARVGRAPGLLVAFNSSRPRASVERTLAGFPGGFRPDALITAMGTEIAVKEPVGQWTERFREWDRSLVDQIMMRFGAVPHSDEFQTPFKASFAVEGDDRRNEVRRALAASPQKSRVIVSGKSDVDVLPPGAGKGEATLFLAVLLGVEADRRLVVAGDSGNDLAMFEVCERGILVGNARDELRHAVDSKRAYQARAPHAAGVLEGLIHWDVLPEAEADT